MSEPADAGGYYVAYAPAGPAAGSPRRAPLYVPVGGGRGAAVGETDNWVGGDRQAARSPTMALLQVPWPVVSELAESRTGLPAGTLRFTSIGPVSADAAALWANTVQFGCQQLISSGTQEISALVAQRSLADDTHHCPHGRPTALLFSKHELERQFRRV